MKVPNSIIFNSINHIRNIPTTLIISTGDRKVLYEETIQINRICAYKTEFYNRIDFHIIEQDIIEKFENIINELHYAKSQYGQNTHLAIRVVPDEKNNKNLVWFFIHSSNISYFSDSETFSGERIYTSILDNDWCCILNDEQIFNGIYHKLLKSEKKLTDEELKFVNDSVIAQNSENWFPTLKEFKEVKKKIEKEEKKNNKIGDKLFSKQKKETNQEEIRGENGEFINPKSLKIHKGSTHPDYELNGIIGLENIKKDIKKMQYMLEYEESRKSRGIHTHDVSSLHMCFMGNPGTGKTTIARIMTGILYNMKYIKNNQCIEISGLDLSGGYVGQTAIITKQIVNMAKGGVLFIDEAYALCENRSGSFGNEAISVLLKEMEDNREDLIVIFAGYEDDMNKFLNMNQGFRSRINKYFDFVDYTTIELGHIFLNCIKKMHLKADEDVLKRCVELFNEAKNHPNFSNGRFVRNLTEQIEEQHILNSVDSPDIERMDIITLEDMPDILIEKMLYGM